MAVKFHKLIICQWNEHSCRKKKDELEQFLKSNNVDLCLLSETRLKNTDKFKICGYRVYRHDCENNKLGTAILVKNEISHYEVPIPDLKVLEATAVNILTKGVKVTVVSIYNSPKNVYCKEDMDTIFNCAPVVFAAGDFNSKHTFWGSRSYNAHGHKLLKFCRKENLLIHFPNEFTRYPDTTLTNPGDPSQNSRQKSQPNLIDFAITKNFKFKVDSHVLHELHSDHTPVIHTINFDCDLDIRKPRYNFAKTNWEKFYGSLQESKPTNTNLESTDDIDREIKNITKNIKAAIEVSTPKRTNKQKDLNLPTYIQDLISDRNILTREIRKCPHNKLMINARNRIHNQVQKQIKIFKCNSWNNTVKNLKITDHTLWKMTKVLTRDRTNIPPLKDDNNTLKYFSPQDKANRLGEYLATTMTPHSDPSIPEYIQETDALVEDFLKNPCTEEIPLTNLYQIKFFFKKTKNNKAPGEDGISNFIMKKLPEHTLQYLADIFNACFRLNYFPSWWKKAIVKVLYKGSGKDPNQPSNYRPISLLNTMSKALEAMFMDRFQKHIDDKKLISDEQFGFRHGHSTQHQILRVLEFITIELRKNSLTSNKRKVGAVLLDVAKAFDSVWHNGLLRKLIEYKIPDCYIAFLNSYLKSRKFQVDVDNHLSSEFDIKSGVPQGSLIGPKIFNIYIDDMPRLKNVETAVYADDRIYYTSSTDMDLMVLRLNDQLEATKDWCYKNRIKINADKSNSILFTRSTKDPPSPPEFNGIPIPWVDNVDYLGIRLDKKLSFSKHATKVRNKATGAINRLLPLLKSHSALGLKNGVLIYKMLIRPIITYAPAIWGNMHETHMKKLERVQNRVLRLITNAPRFTKNDVIRRDLNIETIKDYSIKLTKNFYDSCSHSDYELIRALGTYLYDERDDRWPLPIKFIK